MDSKEKMGIISKHIFKINSIYSEYAHKANTTYNRLVIYYAIKEAPNCTQKHIVEYWGVPKQTVNTVIQNLIKEGMVELIKQEGKREKIIFVTEFGKVYISNIIDKIMEFENLSIEVLNDDEFKKLDDYMKKFSEKFESMVLGYE